jgi:SPRY domain
MFIPMNPAVLLRAQQRRAAAVSTTTWSASPIGTDITLSGGNLIASHNSNGFENVRSVASASSGKKYWEMTIGHADTGFVGMGACNSTASANAFLGADVNAVDWNASGTVFVNSNHAADIQTFATGDTICCAFDIGGMLIWFRTNGGNWNNSGAANPATGAGGVDLTSAGLAAGPYFAACQMHDTPDSVTANFGATAFAQTAPSGFGNW